MHDLFAALSFLIHFVHLLIHLVNQFLLSLENIFILFLFQDLDIPFHCGHIFHYVHFNCLLHAVHQEFAFLIINLHEIIGILSHGVLQFHTLLHVVFTLLFNIVFEAFVEIFQLQGEILQLGCSVKVIFLVRLGNLVQFSFDTCILLDHKVFNEFNLLFRMVFKRLFQL